MSKLHPLPSSPSGLRTFSSRFKGPALLVCRKCERKLKHSGGHTPVANLKKPLKKLAKQDPARRRIHIIPVSCLKLCPKGAITVCTQSDLRQTPAALTLIRTREDIAELYQQCVADIPSTQTSA